MPTLRHFFPQDPCWVRPGTLKRENGRVKQLTSLALGPQKGREQGGKASGFPPSLTAWREGCCQFHLLPCWKKVEVTRGPPGRQPGTRNSIVLPPETGPFFGDPFPEIVLTLKKKDCHRGSGLIHHPWSPGSHCLHASRFAQKDFHFLGCSTTSLTHNKYTDT